MKLQFKNVISFDASEDHLVVNEDKGISILRSTDGEKLWESDLKAWYLKIIGKSLFFQTENGKSLYEVDLNNFESHEVHGEFYLFRAINNEEKLLIEDGNKIKILKSISSTDKAENTALSRMPNVLESNVVIRKRQNTIVCETLYEEDNKLWQVAFESNVFGEIQIYRNLVIATDEEGNIKCLNLYTGKVNWENKIYPYPKIDKKDGKIYALQGGYECTVLEISNGDLVKKELWSEDPQYPGLKGAFGGSALIFDDSIVIPNNDTCEIFIIGKQSLKVKQYLKLNVPKREARNSVRIAVDPIFINNTIYVLDSEHTLHIFDM